MLFWLLEENVDYIMFHNLQYCCFPLCIVMRLFYLCICAKIRLTSHNYVIHRGLRLLIPNHSVIPCFSCTLFQSYSVLCSYGKVIRSCQGLCVCFTSPFVLTSHLKETCAQCSQQGLNTRSITNDCGMTVPQRRGLAARRLPTGAHVAEGLMQRACQTKTLPSA